MASKIVVVDYGMGNLWSVASALSFLRVNFFISSDPREVLKADIILLPGVGSFRLAMQALTKGGLEQAIKEAVTINGRKILGICLGFQLLGEYSSEDGMTSGLGLIPASVERFGIDELNGKKLPHIGFNRVSVPGSSSLFDGFRGFDEFYFVHSFRFLPEYLPGTKALCNYGVDFLAAYEHDNVFGVQFRPEKSQTNGLRLLANFLGI